MQVYIIVMTGKNILELQILEVPLLTIIVHECEGENSMKNDNNTTV